jgi:tRNA pseudouridine38-40 synthase
MDEKTRQLRALIAYQGTRYLGWQKTAMGPSIQQTLEKALATALRTEIATEAASRTDAGVHARGQVIAFQTARPLEPAKLKQQLNGLLPPDIALFDLTFTSSSPFHPTLDAQAKEYHYQIIYGQSPPPSLRDFAWHYPRELDLQTMQEAAHSIVGTHNFASFCNASRTTLKDPICHIYHASVDQVTPGQITIKIIGSRFLYKMVRNLVGTLLYLGCKRLPGDMDSIIGANDRRVAGITAPAKGLFLQKVYYDLPQ